MSDVVLKAVNEGLADVSEKFNAKWSALNAEVQELSQKVMVGGGAPIGTKSNPLSKIAGDDRLKAVLSGESKSARIVVDGLSVKSVINAGGEGSTSGGDRPYPTQAQRAPGLWNDPRIALSLVNTLPRLPVSSATWEYVQLDSYSNSAAEQKGEGETKATATVDTQLASVRIATFAHTLKVSEQVLADNPALSMSLQNLMGFGCLAKLESALINFDTGDGDGFDGLIDVATPFSPSATTVADSLGECAAAQRTAGWNPSHVLLSPGDWFRIASERDNEGAYVSSAWGAPVPATLWGMSVVVCPTLADGTALIIDAAQLVMLDRQQVIVELGRSGDDFERNLFTLRAEMRAALAVMSPASVASVDIAALESSSA